MELVGIGLQNFKGFGSTPRAVQGFQKLNLLIGKNNAGKSSVLEILNLLFSTPGDKLNPALAFYRHKADTALPIYVFLTLRFDENELKSFFESSTSTGNINHWRDAGALLVGEPITLKICLSDILAGRGEEAGIGYSLAAETLEKLKTKPGDQKIRSRVIEERARSLWRKTRETFVPVYIPSSRITNSSASGDGRLTPNGFNLPAIVDFNLNTIGQDHRLVEEVLCGYILRQFPRLGPHLKIRAKKIPAGGVEILFEESGRPALPLKNYGSGLSDVLILMAHLVFVNWAGGKKILYLIEEPEHALHPELQRKLLAFYKDFFSREPHLGLVTTQSPSLIDWSGDVALFRIFADADGANMEEIGSANGAAAIRDLGFFPSHILQSDVVVFVEGPSDLRAIEAMLTTVGLDPNSKNISVLLTGGDNLRHMDVTRLKKLNPSFLIFLDSDCDSLTDSAHPLAWKKDLEARCVAEGVKCILSREFREIENLFPDSAYQKHFNDPALKFGPFDDIPAKIANYSKKKDTPAIAASLSETDILGVKPLADLIAAVKALVAN